MKTEQSIEDYLEAIHVIGLKADQVHQVDVARKLNVSQPAVTKAIRKLKELNYVRTEGMHIFLTAEGQTRATEIYGKHTDIRAFLESIGAQPDDAERDACLMEHVISDSTYDAIRAYMFRAGYKREN